MRLLRVSLLWLTVLFLSVGTYMLQLLLLGQIGDGGRGVFRQNLTILLWHWPFGVSYSLDGDVCRDAYGIPGCFLKENRSLFSQADVVVFHHHELWTGRSRLPLHLSRPPAQKWLWLSLEPPGNNGNLSAYGGLFNWTMSYRRDADIFMPYGEMVPQKTNGYLIPKKGPCLACWVVNNYQEHHNRSQVYQRLKQFIQIQVYGQWTKRRVTAEKLLPTIARCYFYLAFENSMFKDYITEKLWRNSFQAGTVPVVLGPPRPNYEALVPSDTFIHVDDFKSARELAAFLTGLASNKQHYESYFKWHQRHVVKTYTDWRERLCHICAHYHQLPTHKVYHDLHSWANR